MSQNILTAVLAFGFAYMCFLVVLTLLGVAGVLVTMGLFTRVALAYFTNDNRDRFRTFGSLYAGYNLLRDSSLLGLPATFVIAWMYGAWSSRKTLIVLGVYIALRLLWLANHLVFAVFLYVNDHRLRWQVKKS